MKKNFRNVKAILLMGLLIFAIFAVITPSSSASILGIVNCNAILRVEPVDPTDLEIKIEPVSETASIPIKIGYAVTGLFTSPTTNALSSLNVPIALTVEPTPDWITVSLEPNVVNPRIGDLAEGNAYAYDTVNMRVSFSKNAPANERVAVGIKMEADKISGLFWAINEKTSIGQLTIIPQFLPVIDATPVDNLKEVSPGEFADFKIELTNLGNAETQVIFDIVDSSIPKGWSANIPAYTFVGSEDQGSSPKKTVTLRIQPPYSFGYHNEVQDIKVELYGRYWSGKKDVNLTTETFELTFTIRNRGFSTPGFEGIIVIAAFVVVAGTTVYLKKRKKR